MVLFTEIQSLAVEEYESWVEDNCPTSQIWFKWLTYISLGLMLLGILIGAGTDRLSSLMAYLNCLVVGWTLVKLSQKRSICVLFPIAFLAWLIMGCSVAPIYYAIFNPEATYQYYQPVLFKNLKFQLAVFAFLIPYIMTTLWSMQREIPYIHLSEKRAQRLNLLTFLLFSLSALVFVFVQVFKLPGEGYAGTFLNYTSCLALILGIHIRAIRIHLKVLLLGYFAVLFFFFALANARRYALVPMLAFLLGIFFLSRVTTRTKVVILLIMLVLFPAYMVVGNTVRYLLGEVGFEDLGYRAQVLKEWKYVAQQVSWADSVFGRFFFTGGHAVVTRTPEEIPYLGFNPKRYFLETAISFIPGKLKEHMTFYIESQYAYNFHLNNYGFHLTEEHQVGISIFGHFWVLGGYPFMIVGGVMVALLQWAACSFVNRSFRVMPEKGLFYLAFLLPSFIWMSGRGFIAVLRGLFWQMVLAVLFYYVFIWPFLKRNVSEGASADLTDFY